MSNAISQKTAIPEWDGRHQASSSSLVHTSRFGLKCVYMVERDLTMDPSSLDHSVISQTISSKKRKRDSDSTAAPQDASSASSSRSAGGGRPRKRTKKVKKPVKPMTAEELEAYNKDHKKRGVVYLSRIPPGMTASTLRSIFGQHDTIGRIYLTPEDQAITRKRKKFKKSKRRNYVDGWVEFQHKKIAKAVAEAFNNTPIGGPKRSRYHDDLWNVKYLKKFKWNHLTEKIAYEREVRETRTREALVAAQREDKFLMEKVHQSKRLLKKAERLQKKKKKDSDEPKGSSGSDDDESQSKRIDTKASRPKSDDGEGDEPAAAPEIRGSGKHKARQYRQTAAVGASLAGSNSRRKASRSGGKKTTHEARDVPRERDLKSVAASLFG